MIGRGTKEEFVQGLVSIIIPVYKVERFITACIQSVINQSYKNIEVILVDDDGGDSSIAIAEELLLNSDVQWIIIRNKNNRGLSYSRNIGVESSHGQYLYFLDSDDYIDVDCITSLHEEIIRSRSDMVFGSFAYDVDSDILPTPWRGVGHEACTSSPLLLYIRQKAFVMACNRLIDRKFYNNCRVCFKEGIVHEDEPWSFSLIIRAKRISFVKRITYYYRKHQGSITAQNLDEFRLLCQFYHLRNCTEESFKVQIWKYKEFKIWYARLIFSFCAKVINSQLISKDKIDLVDRVYSELRIPKQEMNEIFLYSIAKRMSLFLPNYKWLVLLVKLKKIKTKLISFVSVLRMNINLRNRDRKKKDCLSL